MTSKFLIKHRKGIASLLLTLFFSEATLAAYQGLRIPVANTKIARSYYLPMIPIWELLQPREAWQSPAIEAVAAFQPEAGPGPGQPETQSFQSVGSNNLVDLFSGDFSYSIPLLDVGGYPVNLHYQSGISMDQEASWVGLGWNINPGTVNRNMRGIPDDFNGEDVITKTNSIRPNWTAGANISGSFELAGFETLGKLNASANLGLSLFYNNYRGVGIGFNSGLSLASNKGAKGTLTAGIDNNSQSGVGVNAGISFSSSFEQAIEHNNHKATKIKTTGFSVGTGYHSRAGLQNLSISGFGSRKYIDENKNESHSLSINVGTRLSFAHQSYTPSSVVKYTTQNFYTNVQFGGNVVVLHPNAKMGGFYSRQFIAKDDKVQYFPSVGYLYLEKSQNRKDVLTDFNREKELAISSKPPTPHLAIPSYTYDIFGITGEGTGGSFRAYRGDIGYVKDPEIKSGSYDGGLSGDVGVGNIVHLGTDVQFNTATTKNGGWEESNHLKANIPFKSSDKTFEAAYFKNSGETTVNSQEYYDAMGDTDILLPAITVQESPDLMPYMERFEKYQQKNTATPRIAFDAVTSAQLQRTKRSQHISFLTNEEAALVPGSEHIKVYHVGDPIADFCACYIGSGTCTVYNEQRRSEHRKPHHISEVTVLNEDGRRYVYGIPAYNTYQKQVSFSVAKATPQDEAMGLVGYAPGDNSKDNKRGKDHFFNAEEMPGYANSYLLTGLLSTDYVNTQNNINSEPEVRGEAVKFNYARLYGFDNRTGTTNMYRWRVPYERLRASYNEGLKTDNSDDKGSYVYGEKEIWYLHSLESKTMVAAFVLNNDATERRKDGFGVLDENGGRDETQSLRFLKRIDLFSKEDLIRNNTNAKPIKSVHFDYSYELAKGNPGSLSGEGKLTLKKVWFTYNGNTKGEENAYVFLYHPENVEGCRVKNLKTDPACQAKNEFNPNYHNKGYDRWGNYKSNADNPGGLDNADYPYTLQEGVEGSDGAWTREKAAINIAAWTLSDIILPSGGRMNVQYEADDYAFVQNKQAMQFFNLIGVGGSNNLQEKKSELYGREDYNYVFIQLLKPVSQTGEAAKAEIKELYLKGVEKIHFRYKVTMPSDVYGGGEEFVPTYAQWEDFGVTTDPSIIWLKLKGTDRNGGTGDKSVLAQTAIQTLRLNLPSKAYPGSDQNGEFDPGAIINAVLASMRNYVELVADFSTIARARGWAKQLNTSQSFARLNVPDLKKLGGGLRVKQITIYDNWEGMTDNKEKSATYGQEYLYTTTREVNGAEHEISSGVATFEPGIGNEENPFRLPIEYQMQVAPLAPVANMYSEEPLGEGFFPSPSVGYSKVRVRSIHYDKKKSANGIEESQFYTAYDFPTRMDKTVLDTRIYRNQDLLSAFNIYSKKTLTMAQGFRIELNDMHGKIKETASYATTDEKNPLSYTKYYYKVESETGEALQLDNSVSVMKDASGVVQEAQIGKEIELIVDFREQKFESMGGVNQFNVSVFSVGVPVSSFSAMFMPSYELNLFRSAAVTKVVSRYGILYKVKAFDKGSTVETENLVYDGETGAVLLTATQNEFDDPVYNFSYPAHWAYSGMGSAYKNQGAIFRSVNILNGKLVSGDIEQYFESGDEILVQHGTQGVRLDNSGNCGVATGACDANLFLPASPKKIWAIDAKKVKAVPEASGIYFIDEDGRFYSGRDNTLKIIRSGRRNMAAATIGAVTSMANPVRKINGVDRLSMEGDINAIQTSAMVYNDVWKVEDIKRTVMSGERRLARNKVVLNPVPGTPTAIIKDHQGFKVITNTPYFAAIENYPLLGFNKSNIQLQTVMKFDFSAIPAGVEVLSSTLALQPYLHSLRDRTTTGKEFSLSEYRTIYNTGNNRANTSRVYAIGGPTHQMNRSTVKDFDPVIEAVYLAPISAEIVLPSMVRQSSVMANTTSIVQDIFRDPARNKSWFRIDGDGGNNNRPNAMTFWSVDAPEYFACSYYGPQLHPVRATTPNIRTTSNREVSLQQDPSTIDNAWVDRDYYSQSIAGVPNIPGTHFKFCSTAPELTIEYRGCAVGERMVSECGIEYCEKVVEVQVCESEIAEVITNPYRWGMMGVWRPLNNYAWYENRKEQIADNNANTTNIRQDGTLASFEPFWQIANDGGSLVTSNNPKWIWSTRSLAFNRHGAEVENKDMLELHNAVQYGYSSMLPVAVTTNAMLPNQGYLNFEETAFRELCLNCPPVQHIDQKTLKPNISSTFAHSGNYSLKIDAGRDVALVVPVKENESNTPILSEFEILKENRGVISRIGNGQGVMSRLAVGYPFERDNYGLDKYNNDFGIRIPMLPPIERIGIGVGYNLFNFTSIGFNNSNQFSQSFKWVWEGYLQLRTGREEPGGSYTLRVTTTKSAVKLWVDGKQLINEFPVFPSYDVHKEVTVELQPGKQYFVRMENVSENSSFFNKSLGFTWRKPGSNAFVQVPREVFHTTKEGAENAITRSSIECTTWKGVKVDQPFVQQFAPQPGNYVVSAWVKEEADCNCTTYEHANIKIAFRDENGTTIQGYGGELRPERGIIEGWQRIEQQVTVPDNAATMEVQFSSPEVASYFDDFRMHPFQGNMKSFVYHPENLRLMAELDENNYATFYEYDDDGTLIRVKKETERGIKTIKETRTRLVKKETE